MAGIYIHIPYCKQACHYCDFHFSTTLHTQTSFIAALLNEIELQKNYLQDQNVNTIYFGGGTPSLLTSKELSLIFEKLYAIFSIDKDAEITLEANPDDLSGEKITVLKKFGINRLSIGVQSFYDEDLMWMNRAHRANDAENSVKQAQDKGFENITIDLMYGLPNLTSDKWKKNLSKAFALNVPHISAYCLTVEPKTALAKFIKTGNEKIVDEDKAAEHFETMLAMMKKNNFIQYEISNFCKDKYFSKHNSNYWKGEHYLGLGPSAHSFNGISRQWNVANNNQYISSLEDGKLNYTNELLSKNQRHNEYVLTALRTIWGINKKYVTEHFGKAHLENMVQLAMQYHQSEMVKITENELLLTDKGKLFADKIAADLFV